MTIRSDTRQLYLQVIDRLKKDIENGLYKEKEKLPSEFELSKRLGVSRTTLREALRLLEEENVLTRRHGVGTFVNTKPLFSSGIENLNSVTDMIISSGKTPGAQYISTEIIEASIEDKNRFMPKEIDSLAKIERVRTADGEPVVYCVDKIVKELIPIEKVHNQDSIFHVLEDYGSKHVSYAVTHIEPVGFHADISPLLNSQPDQSLLLLKQMHYTDTDEPVLYSANYFRSDVFSFYVVRKRI
ncbi:GntR family transcriptional regulator [Sediminibacillus massiliensis]|uniref:GntR family transcriptional regulator n=1 Tax=Sediminibacillus massiliensis TaxID=1926277 RepID=UPI0009884E46|nr:GntR family transcriptional regulator [Sediminibacillus massiliensis]